MALTIPTLTWTMSADSFMSPANNAAEFLTELKALIVASTNGWRALDDDIGAGDTYLWIGAPAAAPNADDRIFIWSGTAVVNAVNVGQNQSTAATVIMAGFCPGHGGAVPDNNDPTIATPVSSTRWTRLCGWDVNTSIDRIRIVESEEVLVIMTSFGFGSPHVVVMGPFVSAFDDASGEAGDNGRVYGLSKVGWAGVLNNVWDNVNGLFYDYSAAQNYGATILFDPQNPNNDIRCRKEHNLVADALPNWQDEDRGGTTYRVRWDVPMVGSNLGTNATDKQFGVLRQIRMCANRNTNAQIKNGAGGTVQSLEVIGPNTATGNAIAFDNG